MDQKADEPLSIFKSACEQFRSSLSPAQQTLFAEYPSAVLMLDSIREQADSHPSQKTTLAKCCKMISSISERLSPFFEVVNLFVSSHPELAGLAWGSLRLVFVLGTNHAQFLERVCSLLENMSLKLPVYEDFLQFWETHKSDNRPPPTRLFQAMAYIYSDLLQFCFDVCQLLSRKRSSFLKLRGSFLSSLSSAMLNPFHLRYDTLLKRWDQHSKLVELEISLLTGMEQMEAVERIELILKKFLEVGLFEDKTTDKTWRDMDEIKYRLRRWINAPAWLVLYENSLSQRELHTNEWFIRHNAVSQWLQQQATSHETATPQILSVQGTVQLSRLC